MTLLAFQQAICELIASPARCLAARAEPEAFLARYDLSPRERARLQDIVWQRGMSTSCTLHRSNRATPIYTMLHATCLVLGPRLHALLDEYWAATELLDLEFRHEIERFAHFLREKLAAGGIDDPYLREILDFESALNQLRFLPRRKLLERGDRAALERVVRFDHDPEELLTALGNGTVPQGLAARESYLRLSAVEEELRMETAQ